MPLLGVGLSTIWTQFFPPPGPLGEANLPVQTGRVFAITGGTSGIGFVLARILYNAGGKVYILTRSKERAENAIAEIKASSQAGGQIEFIYLDLSDFVTIKSASEELLLREGPNGRLDVLFNNGGTGGRQNAPPGRQGYEYHLTTNSMGAFLLSRLLLPLLSKTAQHSPQNSVRIVWPCSILVELNAPKTGFRPEWLQDYESTKHSSDYVGLYTSSKVGNWFLASEFARRHQKSGVLQIAGNPGTYNTNMWQYTPWLTYALSWPILRNTKRGADTYLWMGFSDSITLDDSVAGRYAMCDGRWHPGQREDLVLALREKAEGGSGRAAEFYDWCETATESFR